MGSADGCALAEQRDLLLRVGDHLQAARLLVDGVMALAPPTAVGGIVPYPHAAADHQTTNARWMERAATHQTRALVWLRKARDPSAGPLPASQRRDLMLRALEHILAARRLLLQAQEVSSDPDLLATLEMHLGRLETTARSTERLLQELDTAAQG